MDKILSDRTFKIIILVIGVILIIDIVNVFALGGPSLFSLIFKSGNSAEQTASLAGNPVAGAVVQGIVTPAFNQSNGISAGSAQAIYVPTKATPLPTVNYVTSVTPIKVATSQPSLRSAQPVSTLREDADAYTAIYSNDLAYSVQDVPSAVAFNVVNPPIVVNYTVSPLTVTDVKNIYNHTATHKGADELVNVTRPSEYAWFTVTIYDKATGREVAQDGYGNLYGLIPQKTFTYRTAGNYLIQFDGENADVHVDMFIKREGNLV
jgi:hypothetical protein